MKTVQSANLQLSPSETPKKAPDASPALRRKWTHALIPLLVLPVLAGGGYLIYRFFFAHPEAIARDRVIGTYNYHHPVYTTAAPAAQRRHGEISGINRTHYAGAYWGYGFHEDGVNGALAACAYFGKRL